MATSGAAGKYRNLPYPDIPRTPARSDTRGAHFADEQAALTPEELERQTEQNHAYSQAPIVKSTAYSLLASKRWFIEFLEDQHSLTPAECETRYFTPGVEAPPTHLLKEYARYLARSRTGRLNKKLDVKTVQHYVRLLFAMLHRQGEFSYSSLFDSRVQLQNFITNDLVEQEGLLKDMRRKAAAHINDVEIILEKLYDPLYLNTFSNMRIVLNLNLYMVLIIDTCGRGGEIAHHALYPAHHCLLWEDVRFYVFQRDDDDSFDIRASVTINWSKGQRNDQGKYKVIPLAGLLPTKYALQDTLRLLLTTALMDGVFADDRIKKWKDLYRLRLPLDVAQTGRMIPIKPAMRKVPVLRQVSNHKVTTTPTLSGEMQSQINRLGKACGFEDGLTAYCLRRGVAYALANNTTKENRRFLMGHEPRSKVFYAYLPHTSTIDFPAMYRGLDTRDVLAQSGISLNRSLRAPQRLSDAGQDAVHNDARVKTATEHIEAVKAAILQYHPSLAAAARTDDPMWSDYKQAVRNFNNITKKLSQEIYRREYQEHFQNLGMDDFVPGRALPDVPAGEGADGEQEINDVDGAGPDDDVDLDVDMDMEEGPDATATDTATIQQALDLINAQPDDQFEEYQPPENEDVDDSDEEYLRGEDSANNDVVANENGNVDAVQQTGPTTRLHKLPDKCADSGRGIGRALYKGDSAYNDMKRELAEHENDEAAMAAIMSKWYSVVHGIDDFSPGQEPLPGTYECRFCQLDLNTPHHPYEHTHACAKQEATERKDAMLDAVFNPTTPCQYQVCGHGENLHQFVVCGKTFDDAKERGEHARDHMRSMTKKDAQGNKVPTCFYDDCAQNPQGGRLRRDGPDFVSKEHLIYHLWNEHGVSTLKATEVQFYEYCQTWLLEPHELVIHALEHKDDVQKIIDDVGFGGVRMGRTIIPRICPFCLYNKDLLLHLKIFTYDRESYGHHIAKHIDELDEKGLFQQCPCYPKMCTESREFDAACLNMHISMEHGCVVPDRFFKKNKGLQEEIAQNKANKARKKARDSNAASSSRVIDDVD